MVSSYDTYILVSKLTQVHQNLAKVGVDSQLVNELLELSRKIHKDCDEQVAAILAGHIVDTRPNWKRSSY